jgi:amidase
VVPAGDVHPWFGQSESGPLATTVRDAALLLGVMAGRAVEVEAAPRPLRIALAMRSPAPGMRVQAERRAAAERVAELLAGAGHAVERVRTPRSISIALALTRRWCAFVADDVERLGLDADKLEPLTRTHLRMGRRFLRKRPPSDADSERMRALLGPLFAEHDLVLQPALAQPPPSTASLRGGWLRSTFRMSAFTPFTPPWNLAQYPAMAVPAGLDSRGLPVAAMLGGPPGSEARMLSVAAQVESLAPWPRHAPI